MCVCVCERERERDIISVLGHVGTVGIKTQFKLYIYREYKTSRKCDSFA